MTDLSIVIASYNTREMTAACLDALIERTAGIEVEIIVVDNASSDGSAAFIAGRFPQVSVIHNDCNVGFAPAQNIGMLRSHGRFVAALNSDCIVVGNALKTLTDFLDADPRAGAVGPQILNADGSVAPSARRALMSRPMVLIGIINRHFRFKRLLPERAMRRMAGGLLSRWHDNYADHSAMRESEVVDGMCVVFRRSALEQVGLFDEQFFFDLEINDLSNRLRAGGWRVVFNPDAKVTHLAHSSRKKVSRIVVETHRSELTYYAKYAPHYLPAVRRTTRFVVGTRLALARILGASKETIDIYREILAVVDAFDPRAAREEPRIPALQELPT